MHGSGLVDHDEVVNARENREASTFPIDFKTLQRSATGWSDRIKMENTVQIG